MPFSHQLTGSSKEMDKNIKYYKGKAFKLFTELNNWKYIALKEMLNVSVINYSLNEATLSKWWNISIQLEKDAKELYEALESELSGRAYKRAVELRKMYDTKVQQLVNYKESIKQLTD